MDGLIQDLRYGLRSLFRSPGVTLIAILTLGLGIGANSAIFSVVNTALLRPLPYPDPGRLMLVMESNPAKGYQRFPLSPLNYVDYRDQNSVLERLCAFDGTSFILTGAGRPEKIQGARVSAGFFETLGIAPLNGRAFAADEDRPGPDQVAILGHGLWQRRFGSDPGVLGRTVTLGGAAYTVVGVMPPGFAFPNRSEIWKPMALADNEMQSRGSHYLLSIGRLRPGVSPERARADLEAIAARLQQRYPDTNTGWTARVEPLAERIIGDARPTLLVLLAAVGFVLLIACANVASLLLARAAARRKEFAVRSALGAGRARLARQLITESLLLGLLGGGLGLLLALWGTDLLSAAAPPGIPRVREVGVDGRVILFTGGVALLTGLLFGLAPALQAARTDLNEALKEGARGDGGSPRRHRARALLVVAETALALVLLAGAGLMLRSLLRLQAIDPGFDPRHVLAVHVELPDARYPDERRRADFFRAALERLASLPGAQAAGAVFPLPMGGDRLIFSFGIEGRPVAEADRPSAGYYVVSPDYFRAMGIHLMSGRAFTERDREGAPRVAIINATMARQFWPGEDPVGRRIVIDNGPQDLWREIVGVVQDVKHTELEGDSVAQMYEPYPQAPLPLMTLTVRAAGAPEGLAEAARRAILALDKDQPVSRTATMDRLLAESIARPRYSLLLLGVFAGVALLLATVGIYGLLSHSVTQRTREIGIRMALGARRGQVLVLVIANGMRLALLGIGAGLLGAIALTRLMSSLLYRVSPTDPATLAAVALLLAGAALLACLVPARRATRVDPMGALRCE
jgi:putative ABC transport system permease protein